MGTGRLVAFSDGVLAVIITIMVLKLAAPQGADFNALRSLWPSILSYILSFIYVGLYWNNHHHLFHIAEETKGSVLWANLHLLFWLSLVPFTTAWMGESDFASLPTAIYGAVLLMAAIAWWILQKVLLSVDDQNALLASAFETTWKENISPLLYIAGIILAFIQPWMACALYAVVALIWIVPDRRIERAVKEAEQTKN